MADEMHATYFLNTSASIQLHGKLHNVVLHLCSKLLLLNHCAIDKKLLYNVVAENVNHQGVRIDHDFVENPLSIVAVRKWDLLLEKPRALLVPSKFDNMSKNVLHIVRIKLTTSEKR